MNKLPEILSLINEWLRFAEAKNGVLVAVAGAGLWAGMRLSMLSISPIIEIYLLQLCLFVLAALIVALVSFLPVMEYELLIPLDRPASKKNVLFFGYLATLRPNTLLQELKDVVGASAATNQAVDEMYAEQIVVNSRIAVTKYRLFTTGVWCLIFGLLTPIVGGIFWLWIHGRRRIDGF